MIIWGGVRSKANILPLQNNNNNNDNNNTEITTISYIPMHNALLEYNSVIKFSSSHAQKKYNSHAETKDVCQSKTKFCKPMENC